MKNFFQRKTAPTAPALEFGLTALRAKGDGGDADAQFSLGLHYSNAVGKALDFAEAARWYSLAAEQNHVLAQFNLGVMFARGQGMPRDNTMAANWIRKAAEGGDAGGQHDLGLRCHRASMNPSCTEASESRIEAYKWFHLAVDQGRKDSRDARQLVTLNMTRTEVGEGNRRAAAFVVRPPSDPTLQ